MDLETIKESLEARRSSLILHVEKIEAGYKRGRSKDSEDRAQENIDNDVRDALANSELREIEQIEQALRRIEKGTYGTCASCNQPIDAKRLQALPATSTCKECAGAL